MRFPKLLLLATSFALTACASSQGSGDSSSTTDASSTVITSDQVMQANVPTAYEAVDRLHREWWQDQTHPLDTVVVYQDNNQKLGDGTKEALRQVPAGDVKTIEYIKSADAIIKFGQSAEGGAIVVTRK